MKINYCFLLISAFVYSNLIGTDSQSPPVFNNSNTVENNPNIHIHIDQQTLSEHITNVANSTNLSAAINNATETIVTISNDIKNGINNTINQVQNFGEQIYGVARHPFTLMGEAYEWTKNNKLTAGLYATAITYVYLNYRLVKTKYLLEHGNHWSQWENTIEIETLFTVPQQELGESLARAAQQRYTNATNPNDFVGPLAQLMLDIESELTLLKSYMRMCHWIQRFCLGKVMWYDAHFLQECAQRKTRLNYLKAAFTYWIAEYKLTHNVVKATT